MIHDTQATVKLLSKLYELIGDVNARFIIDIGYCHFYRVSAAGNKFGRVRPSVSALTFEPSDLRLFCTCTGHDHCTPGRKVKVIVEVKGES